MAFQTALRLTANFWARASPEKYVPPVGLQGFQHPVFYLHGINFPSEFCPCGSGRLGLHWPVKKPRDQARQQQDGGIEGDGGRPRHPDGHGQLADVVATAPSILMTQMWRRSRGASPGT